MIYCDFPSLRAFFSPCPSSEELRDSIKRATSWWVNMKLTMDITPPTATAQAKSQDKKTQDPAQRTKRQTQLNTCILRRNNNSSDTLLQPPRP